jgi:hypothetical protein
MCNEILQDKVTTLMQNMNSDVMQQMVNSHTAVSTRKEFNNGVWFGLLLMKNEVSKIL